MVLNNSTALNKKLLSFILFAVLSACVSGGMVTGISPSAPSRTEALPTADELIESSPTFSKQNLLPNPSHFVTTHQIFAPREIIPYDKLDFRQWDRLAIYTYYRQKNVFVLREGNDLVLSRDDFGSGRSLTAVYVITPSQWLTDVLAFDLRHRAPVPEPSLLLLLGLGLIGLGLGNRVSLFAPRYNV